MLKLIVVFSAAVIALAPFVVEAKSGSHSVKGYTTKKGTYVAPHQQTNPDKSKMNNWSTKGNTNPYTGKPGMKNPY